MEVGSGKARFLNSFPTSNRRVRLHAPEGVDNEPVGFELSNQWWFYPFEADIVCSLRNNVFYGYGQQLMESRHHKTSQRRKRRCLNLFGVILLIFSLCRGSIVSEAKISRYDPLVKKHARRYGFDWRLISAQIYAESSFRPNVVSHAGAVGLMQIMPSTAKWLGVYPKLLTKPEVSISLGCYYDWRLYSALKDTDTERDRLAITLASYNCGPGRMRRARRKSSNGGSEASPSPSGCATGSWAQVKPYLPKETRHYVPKVFSKYAEYKKITL